MGKHKILTMEQLVKVCEEKKLYSFDSKQAGFDISVQIPGTMNFEEKNKQSNTMFTKVKVCHTLLNRNGSYISEDNMKKAMPSLKNYVPLLGYIHKLDDGTYDFRGHDFEIITNDDGEEEVVYKEKQIGTFTTDDPYLEYDKEMDKTYVMARAAIPIEYTRAAEIIERKGGTKVSCELLIHDFSYNATEKRLELEDFEFVGVTCLGSYEDGTEIGEGMLGSRLDIEDFSEEKNSIFSHIDVNRELIKTLNELNATLSSFNKTDENQKGGHGMNKLNELLEKYGKTLEDLDFETENLSDEELESKFAEMFDEADTSTDDESGDEDEVSEETETVVEEETSEEEHEDEEGENQDEESEEDSEDESKKKKYEIKIGEQSFEFEVSLNEKWDALSTLVNATYSEADNTYYGVDIYETYLVMIDYWSGSAYKQTYKQDGSNFSLTGDRIAVHSNWLTEEEEAQLQEMRSNYAVISEKLASYEKAEEDAAKANIFSDVAYAEYLEEEEFKTLMENQNKYSVDELKDKAEIAFAKCVKKNGSFSVKEVENKPSTRKQFSFSKKETKKKNPYSTILKDKD